MALATRSRGSSHPCRFFQHTAWQPGNSQLNSTVTHSVVFISLDHRPWQPGYTDILLDNKLKPRPLQSRWWRWRKCAETGWCWWIDILMEHLVTSLPAACPPDNFFQQLIPTWKMDQQQEELEYQTSQTFPTLAHPLPRLASKRGTNSLKLQIPPRDSGSATTPKLYIWHLYYRYTIDSIACCTLEKFYKY